MSQQTIRPTSMKPSTLPNEPMSPIATIADVISGINGTTTPLVLPTSDPLIAGAIWNNSGTVTVSAG